MNDYRTGGAPGGAVARRQDETPEIVRKPPPWLIGLFFVIAITLVAFVVAVALLKPPGS